MASLPPLPPDWTEHTAPTGHKYYYNASTKKSTYQRPVAQIPEQAPPNPQTVGVPLTEWSSEVARTERSESPERQTARIMGQEALKKLEDRPRKASKIPGVEPWLQVTTKWRRTFYHNPTTKESYWKLPESIREAVEKTQIETARAKLAATEASDSEEDEDDYPEEDKEEAPVEFTEEDIAYQLAMMQGENYEEDQMQEEEELDDNAKRQIFISLLEDKEINPFNTWENEMPKMVQDPRYSMLRNTKQRMEIFGEWARARIALIKEEKEHEVKEDPKVAYLKFLAEKADPKEYWFEFRRKYRKAPEYKHFGTEKLREDVWRDMIARKKTSKEKREMDLLSWMKGIKGNGNEVMEKVRMDVRYWVIDGDRDSLVRDALRGR